MSARECPAESYRDGLPCGLPVGHDGCHEAQGGGVVWLDAPHPAPEPPSEVTAEELAEAVMPRLVNVSNLPEWMQIAALGRPMRPLATLVADAILARYDVRERP